MVNRLLTKSLRLIFLDCIGQCAEKRGHSMIKHKRPTRGWWDWMGGGGKDDTGSNG